MYSTKEVEKQKKMTDQLAKAVHNSIVYGNFISSVKEISEEVDIDIIKEKLKKLIETTEEALAP